MKNHGVLLDIGDGRSAEQVHFGFMSEYSDRRKLSAGGMIEDRQDSGMRSHYGRSFTKEAILEPTGARYCIVEKMMEIKIIDLHTCITCHMLAYILAVTLSIICW